MRRNPGAGSRGPGPGGREPVAAALRAYADRGVFRGFNAAPAGRARTTFQFLWLTRRPFTAVSDSRARTLTFPDLFPGVDRHINAHLKAVVDARIARDQPAHKRIDGRRARAGIAVRGGNVTLRIVIRGDNEAYAVQAALNLINDLFVVLHEHHPEYLIQQFGISSE